MMRDYFKFLGLYNMWANRTLYEAVATLSQDDIALDRNAYFGSILGTLNHLLLADRVWMARLSQEDLGWFRSLDQILYADFGQLREQREASDQKLVSVIQQTAVTGDLNYVNSQGKAVCMPLSVVLGHVFNHQTHHRGQVHGLLSQVGLKPPALDIAYFPRATFVP